MVRRLHRHDPEWYALHKAIKVAVVVTTGLAIGTLTGNGQLSLFASFGGVALLLFADFPGSRSARFGAYIGLAVIGAVLIALGTLASGIAWVAVLGMAVVGFLVLFAGVLSAAAAGATRAALLTFILPVTAAGTAADISARLAGWGVALALAIPAAILVWPPRDHDKLRERAADACNAIAAQLTARSSPATPGGPSAQDDNTQRAIGRLREQFRSTTYRPVGLTTGSRLLMQLTDRLEWLRAVVDRVPPGSADRWPHRDLEMVASCTEVLQASATVLFNQARRPTYATRQRLVNASRDLDQHRAQVQVFLEVVATGATGSTLDPSAPRLLRPAVAHELVYTTQLVGHTVAVSAAADARPLLDRLLGRQAPGSVDGPIAAAHRIVAGHITRGSVWFQNSLRGAFGLTIAVFLVEITQIAHGFWVVLGAMSVLRTTALTTGSTALRALSGTLVGFLAGAVVILLVGTAPWHLWLLLPFVVLIAAYLPEAVSFAAGQAAFTVMVVILFNIIQPVGWTVGLVRIEDIALGCAAGLVSGVLLWPHGAAAQIRSALSEYYRRSADALETATGRLTGHPAPIADPVGSRPRLARPTTKHRNTGGGTFDDVLGGAKAAGLRLDDAFREYLFERGTKSIPVAGLTAVSNGASRVRLAAEAIAGLTSPALLAAEPGPGDVTPPEPALEVAGTGLSGAASAAAGWFRQIAGVLSGKDTAPALPAVTPIQSEGRVLETFRDHPEALHDPAVAGRARILWAAALYVDDVTRLQTRLSGYVRTLVKPARPGAPTPLEAAATPVEGRSPIGSSP